jgi:hypothetical protein
VVILTAYDEVNKAKDAVSQARTRFLRQRARAGIGGIDPENIE